MNKHLKRFFYTACILGANATVDAAVIEWGTSNQQLYAADGDTYLPGNQTRSETDTGFIQLLYLGENGTYDAPDILEPGSNGDGAFGDDVVIGQSWVGDGNSSISPDIAGQFTASDTPSATEYTSGVADFAIRVFDTAVSDADWEAGNIPTSGYYNYHVFTDPVKTPEPEYNYTLWIDESLATTRVVVPEPGSLLVFLAGLAFLLVGCRRSRAE